MIDWVDAFVDVPAASAAGFRSFWSAVTGWPVSAPRGDRGQFRSLLPDRAASTRAYLRVQELAGAPRVHLDLICAGVSAAGDADASSSVEIELDRRAERMVGLGAAPVARLDRGAS